MKRIAQASVIAPSPLLTGRRASVALELDPDTDMVRVLVNESVWFEARFMEPPSQPPDETEPYYDVE